MRPVDVIRKVAPRARPEYVTAFVHGDTLFAAAGVTTPLRLAHFLAQILEETGGLTIDTESGNYSAGRIREVWPSRPEAVAYAHNAEALFNHVYANRMGNGPPESGDGYKYRGRGVLQTTGREAYRKYGLRCGVDFENNPDLIFSAEHALKPALAEWTDSRCNALADSDDIHTITKRVNGGYTNFAERVRWLHVVKPVIGDRVDLRPSLETRPAGAPRDEVSGSKVPHGEEARSAVSNHEAPTRNHPAAGGSVLAALAAAWKAVTDGASWPVIAAIVLVGVVAAAVFLKPKRA